MALTELIGRLERDAQAKAEALAKQAREEIGRIEAEADRAAGKLREEELAVRRSRRHARLGRELAEARAGARARALKAREGVIDRVFARAVQLLPPLEQDPRARRWLAALQTEAAAYLEGGEGRVTVDLSLKRLLERARPALSIALAKELPS